MSNTIGKIFSVTTFGESHGRGLGVVIDGVPSGLNIRLKDIQIELDRRKPGQSEYTTSRKEDDHAEILSGITDGKATGAPICIIIGNTDVDSSAYKNISKVFRPGHADYTYYKKYGLLPQAGGGRSSGRETAARVAAGAIAKLILKQKGIAVRACTISAGKIEAVKKDYDFAETNPLRFADPDLIESAISEIKSIKNEGDSAGGIVEVTVTGVPAGLGEPVFDKLDAMIGRAILSIGAIKGIEFGSGFNSSKLKGSQNNDPITPEGFTSNNAGGILGGISTGQPIVFRTAVKPTPSISLPQQSIDINNRGTDIRIKGRHDPFICPRVVPVLEAMTAIVLADLIIIGRCRSFS